MLLVTLGLLVLSTTLLVAVGRAAAGHVLTARTAQDELQRRWAVNSCRAAVLPNAEQILVTAEQSQHRPVPVIQVELRLGDDSVELLISDEQAKANVNSMLDQFGVDGTEDRLRESLSGSGLVNHIRLRPGLIADDNAPTTQPIPPTPTQLIFGPGQIFESMSPARFLPARIPSSARPMQHITCWGGGQLNLMRADETAMRAVLFPTINRLEISRLISARNATAALSIDAKHAGIAPAGNSTDAIGALLSQAKIDPRVRNRLSVSTGSSCHSLEIQLEDQRRSWHWFTVSDQSNPKRPRTDSIIW